MTFDVRDTPTFRCYRCQDDKSGFRPFWCHGMGDAQSFETPAWAWGLRRSCGRVKPHGPHNFVERCECWQARQGHAAQESVA